jgi:hypothetical protein
VNASARKMQHAPQTELAIDIRDPTVMTRCRHIRGDDHDDRHPHLGRATRLHPEVARTSPRATGLSATPLGYLLAMNCGEASTAAVRRSDAGPPRLDRTRRYSLVTKRVDVHRAILGGARCTFKGPYRLARDTPRWKPSPTTSRTPRDGLRRAL